MPLIRFSLPAAVRRACVACVFATVMAAPVFAQYYWTPVFKLRNNQTSQLTAADFPGPGGTNGLAYPNWYYAGIAGGIPAQHPNYDNVLQLSSYAGYDPTGASDQWAVIMRGIEDLHAQGGGVLQLGAGTFLLRESLIITYDNIVIRGAGREVTRIDFRPGIVDGSGNLVKGIKWLYLKDGDTVPLDYLIQVRATQPSDRWINDAAFNYIRIYVNGVQRASTTTDRQGGPNLVTLRASDANSGIAAGQTVTLYGEVDYGGGEVYRTPTINVTFAQPLPYGQKRLTPAYAAFSFAGDEWSRRGVEHTFNLTADAPRGATSLQVDGANAANLALIKPGDLIRIEKPTHGSTFLTERATNANTGTRYLLTVVGTSGGNTIQVAEPLREAFPVAHGSRVKSENMPIRNVGVEDLWIDQSAQQMWTSGIHFLNAHQSWAKNVKVTKIGRFPIWPSSSKNIEIRDVVLDEAWYRLGGGTAYIGFGESNDNLLDGVTGSRLRHGPNFGNFANGNVVRNGIFDSMDAHVGHNAWVTENLVELSTIDARQPEDLPSGFGTSYGHAVTAETRDGPQGPRNTFYNNILKVDPRLSFDRSGLDTSGGMEAFFFVANKIYSVGPTVNGAQRDIDLVFEDNVLIIERASAGVALMPLENAGWEFRNNTIYGGSGQMLASGSSGSLAVNTGNTFLPFDPNWDASIPDPAPVVPSLYQWQLDQKYPAVPGTPGGLSATSAPNAFTVTWNAATNAAAYIVRWGTSAGNYTHSSSGHVARSATISGLQNGTTYHVSVAAVNHRGVSSNATAVTVTPVLGARPAAPTGLTATAAGTSQVNLAWTDVAGNETAYVVQRRNGEFGAWADIVTLGANATSYVNAGLLPNQHLSYRVLARNATGDSVFSNVASATTTNALPAAVTIFNATASSGQVLLTWSAVYNATSYTIQRATTSGGPYTNLQTGFTGDRYTDTAVANGTTYYYRIVSANALGNGPASTERSAVPNGAPVITLTSPTAGTTITGPANLTLTATATDADGSINQVQFFNGTTLLVTDTSSPYSFAWNNVAPGTYEIRAVATDNLGITATTTRYIQLVDATAGLQPPVIIEPFDYATGTAGVDLAGGTGLRSTWGGGSLTMVAAGSLTYSDTGGNALSTSANRLASGGSEWVSGKSTQRDPNDSTNPLWPWLQEYGVVGKNGTVFWVSYLVRYDNGGYAALRTHSPGDELFFGVGTLTGGRFGIQRGQSDPNATVLTGLTPVTGQTYLIVVKYEFGNGDNDTVRMWVNPDIAGAIPSGGTSVTMTGVNASWQALSFRGNPGYSVDELRAGGAFRDVVPATAGNASPTISITSPGPGATVAAPGSATITTQAGGTITQVQFYHGTTLLGSDTTAPYTYTWNNIPAGAYTLRVVASGPLGSAEATRLFEVVDAAATPQAPFIYEGFDYPAGTAGTAMTGGTGLRGAWGGGTTTTTAASSLAHTDPLSGLSLVTSGNRLTSGATEWVSSKFTGRDPNNNTNPLWPWLSGYGLMGADHTRFWMSFLLRYDGAPGWAGLRLHNSTPELFFGAYSLAGGELGIQIGQAAGSPFYGTGLTAQAGQTYLIVLKYEFGASNNDTVRMWVNPRLDRAAPESAHTVAVTGLDATWQNLTFRGNVAYGVDEIRGGAAFVDVVPTGGSLAPSGVSASSFQTGNGPENTVDGNLTTRWAANGVGEFITYNLGGLATISSVKLAWYNGDSRQYTFDVLVGDGTNWTTVLDNAVSSGTTAGYETYTFAPTIGSQVRLVGLGNTSAFPTWVSVSETVLWGVAAGGGGGNAAPSVTQAAAATPNPVTATSASLSVRAADDGGESGLTYTWTTTNAPGGAPAPAFGTNGTNAAKDSIVTFGAAGNYVFQATVSDGALTASSTVSVTVNATPSSLVVTPEVASLTAGATQAFAAVVNNQFGTALASQPTVTWSRTGTAGGSIAASGLYTAGSSAGTDTVTATSGALSDTSTVTVSASGPVAVDDTATTTEETPVTIAVLANDSPQTVSLQSVGSAQYGDTAVNGTQVTYSPDVGFYGNDTFTYTITNGAATDIGSVAVAVQSATAQSGLGSFGLTPTALNGAGGSSRVLTNGYIEITGAGIGPDPGGDQLRLETQATTGDFTITLRVRLQAELPGLQPLAGLVIRDGLGNAGRFAMIGVQPDGTVRWRTRVSGTALGGSSVSLGTTDVWLRIRRVGTRLYTFSSLNGTTWTQRSNNSYSALASSLQAGLFIYSGDGSTAALARFSDYLKTSP